MKFWLEATTFTFTVNPHVISNCFAFLTKQVGTDQGMGEILRKMGVADGEGISFKHFWTLIQSVATSQYSQLSSQMGSSCKCILM